MSRSGSQVDIRQAYPQKAVVQTQVAALPSAPPSLNPSFDPTRPATARVEVTPSRLGGNGAGADTRPNRPSSAHTRLLTTYGAAQPSPDKAAIITKQDLRRKRTEEYLSDRVRQIYNDVGRDTRPVKKHMFHDGGTTSGSGGRSANTYKGDAESLHDTIHALKYQIQQEADKRAKLVARCRRLEQVVAMKDKKLEEALAMQTQHGSYNSYQRELANRERAYNHMLGKLREKIDQQATTLAAYEDTVNDLKASTKHTRVMELEEGLTQLAMELRLMQTKVEDGDRQLAQCYKQLEDRSESTAQKAVKRLRSVVLSLNEDKKRLDKETKVLKAYIVAKERELAAFSVAAKSQPKPKPSVVVVSPSKPSVVARPAVVPDPPTPKPPPSKPAGRPLSASRNRPTSTPGRSVSTPQRPSKGDQAVIVAPKPATPAKKAQKPAAQPPSNDVPPLPLNACATSEPMTPDIPSPPPVEKPIGLELLQTKVIAPAIPAVPTLAAPIEPVKAAQSSPVDSSTAVNPPKESAPPSVADIVKPVSPQQRDALAPETSDDDWLNEEPKDTTEIERILSGGGHSAAHAGMSPTNDDDMDDADFHALMAFETPPRDDANAGGGKHEDESPLVAETRGGEAGGGEEVAGDDDTVGDLAALKIQRIYKVYSRRRDSMELHRETKKQHRQSSSNNLQDALAGAQEAVTQSPAPMSRTNSMKTAPTRIPVETQHQAASAIQKAYRRSSATSMVAPVTIPEAPVVHEAGKAPEMSSSDGNSAGGADKREAQDKEGTVEVDHTVDRAPDTPEQPKPQDREDESYSEPADSEGHITPSESETQLEPKPSGHLADDADGYSEPAESEGQVTPSASNEALHDPTSSQDKASSGQPSSTVAPEEHASALPADHGDDGDEEYSEPADSEGKLTPSSSVELHASDADKQNAAAAAIQKAFRHSSKSSATPRGNARPSTSNDVDDDVYSDVADSDGKVTPNGSESALNAASAAPTLEVDRSNAATTIQKAYRRSSMAGQKLGSDVGPSSAGGKSPDDGGQDEDEVYSDVAASDGVITPSGSEPTLSEQAGHVTPPVDAQQAAAAAKIQRAFRGSSLGEKSQGPTPDTAPGSISDDAAGASAVESVAEDDTTSRGSDAQDADPGVAADTSVDETKQAAAATIQNAFRRSLPSTPRAPAQADVQTTSDASPTVDESTDAPVEPPPTRTSPPPNADDREKTSTPPGDVDATRGAKDAPAVDTRSGVYSDGDDGERTPSTSGVVEAQQQPQDTSPAKELPQTPSSPVEPTPPLSRDSDANGGRTVSPPVANEGDAIEASGNDSAVAASPALTTDEAARTIQQAFRHISPRSATTSPPQPAPAPPNDDVGDEYDDDAALYDMTTPRDDDFLDNESAPRATPSQDATSASDRNLIESVMSHLDDVEDGEDDALMRGADAPLEYDDEFLDDEDEDAENGGRGISEDAHLLVDSDGE